MRREEVVKSLIKWLCKTADGGDLPNDESHNSIFCYINILLIYSKPEVLPRRWLLTPASVQWDTTENRKSQQP